VLNKLKELLAELKTLPAFQKKSIEKIEAQINEMNKEQIGNTYKILSKFLDDYKKLKEQKKSNKEEILKQKLAELSEEETAFKKFFKEYKSFVEVNESDQADDLLKNL
jgi:hypothetical protein